MPEPFLLCSSDLSDLSRWGCRRHEHASAPLSPRAMTSPNAVHFCYKFFPSTPLSLPSCHLCYLLAATPGSALPGFLLWAPAWRMARVTALESSLHPRGSSVTYQEYLARMEYTTHAALNRKGRCHLAFLASLARHIYCHISPTIS
jgi:hypothetical protein